MTTSALLGAALAAIVVVAGLVRGWLTRRRIARLEGERDDATTERDAARATAAGAVRSAELATDQIAADRDGATAAERIRDVPTDASPADRVRAVDAAARVLSDEDGQGPDGRGGRAPAVPPAGGRAARD